MKKKEITPNTDKVIEIKRYKVGDIYVRVKIDYFNNEISLIDELNNDKKWLFVKRGVEYMNSWLNILESMKIAIEYAKRDYEEELAKQTAFKDKQTLSKMIAMQEYEKTQNSKGNPKRK